MKKIRILLTGSAITAALVGILMANTSKVNALAPRPVALCNSSGCPRVGTCEGDVQLCKSGDKGLCYIEANGTCPVPATGEFTPD